MVNGSRRLGMSSQRWTSLITPWIAGAKDLWVCSSLRGSRGLERIQTKSEPVDTVGSKCPNVFGRFGGAAHGPENSVDARSDVNS